MAEVNVTIPLSFRGEISPRYIRWVLCPKPAGHHRENQLLSQCDLLAGYHTKYGRVLLMVTLGTAAKNAAGKGRHSQPAKGSFDTRTDCQCLHPLLQICLIYLIG